MLGDFLANIRSHGWVRRLALFSPTIAVVVVSLALKEFYPISHNPMYSGLGDTSTYFYLTDQDDELLPFTPIFGGSLIRFMKVMRSTRKRIEKSPGKKGLPRLELQREAAPEVLSFFLKTRKPLIPYARIDATSLKVWVVETKRIGKTLGKKTSLLCEMPVPEDLRASGGGESE